MPESSPLVRAPRLPYRTRDSEHQAAVVAIHGASADDLGIAKLTVESSRDRADWQQVTITEEQAPALAAALLAAAGCTQHRVVDLGADLPEVEVSIVDGQRVWEADGEGIAEDDLHPEQTMRALRRRLAVLAAARDADTRHDLAQVEDVAAYLLDVAERGTITGQEARWRAAMLLDRLAPPPRPPVVPWDSPTADVIGDFRRWSAQAQDDAHRPTEPAPDERPDTRNAEAPAEPADRGA